MVGHVDLLAVRRDVERERAHTHGDRGDERVGGGVEHADDVHRARVVEDADVGALAVRGEGHELRAALRHLDRAGDGVAGGVEDAQDAELAVGDVREAAAGGDLHVAGRGVGGHGLPDGRGVDAPPDRGRGRGDDRRADRVGRRGARGARGLRRRRGCGAAGQEPDRARRGARHEQRDHREQADEPRARPALARWLGWGPTGTERRLRRTGRRPGRARVLDRDADGGRGARVVVPRLGVARARGVVVTRLGVARPGGVVVIAARRRQAAWRRRNAARRRQAAWRRRAAARRNAGRWGRRTAARRSPARGAR